MATAAAAVALGLRLRPQLCLRLTMTVRVGCELQGHACGYDCGCGFDCGCGCGSFNQVAGRLMAIWQILRFMGFH